jgi:hypothetical protein
MNETEIYEYGFVIDEVTYGWKRKELFKMPYTSKYGISYPIKKINKIIIGNRVGYRIMQKKYTVEQLSVFTKKINFSVYTPKSPDLPF